jgi:hypothetical protein
MVSGSSIALHHAQATSRLPLCVLQAGGKPAAPKKKAAHATKPPAAAAKHTATPAPPAPAAAPAAKRLHSTKPATPAAPGKKGKKSEAGQQFLLALPAFPGSLLQGPLGVVAGAANALGAALGIPLQFGAPARGTAAPNKQPAMPKTNAAKKPASRQPTVAGGASQVAAAAPGAVPMCEWRSDYGACTVHRHFGLAVPEQPTSFIAQ